MLSTQSGQREVVAKRLRGHSVVNARCHDSQLLAARRSPRKTPSRTKLREVPFPGDEAERTPLVAHEAGKRADDVIGSYSGW